jgi:hypothetical protein
MRQLPRNFHTHQHGMGASPPAFMLGPAYCVLALVRVPLGHDIVRIWPALRRAAQLALLPLLFWWLYVAFTNQPAPANTGHMYLMAFAGISLLATLWVFAKRALGVTRGEQIHPEEAGYSWLAWLAPRLPAWLCEQVIVPAAFAAAGWCVFQTFSLELGLWLMACGASLFVMAVWECLRQRRALIATTAGMIQAQTSGWRVEQHEARARAADGQGHAPQFAEMGAGAMGPPDAMGWRTGGDGIAPDYMTWFRKRSRKPAAAAKGRSPRDAGKERGGGERRDFADLG